VENVIAEAVKFFNLNMLSSPILIKRLCRVLAFLERNPSVKSYKDATPEAGGWGAAPAELEPAKLKTGRL